MTGVEFAGREGPPPAAASQAGRRTPRLLVGLLAIVVFAWWGVDEGGVAPTVWYPGALAFLAALAAVAWAERGRVLPRAGRWALAALAAYTAWSFLSLLWAGDRGDAWDGANRTLLYLTVFALFALVRWTPAEASAVLAAFVGAVWAIGMWALVAAVTGSDPDAFMDGRLAGPVGYENASAALLLAAVWPALVLAVRRQTPLIARALLLAAAGTLFELGILAQSRASVIGVVVTLAGVLWFARERARLCAGMAAVAVTTAASLPFLLAPYADGGDAGPGLRRAGLAIALSGALLFLAGLGSDRVDRRLDRIPPVRGSLRWAATLTAGLLAVSGLAAAGLSSRLAVGPGGGRGDFWRVAAGQLARQPLGGAGADNFANDYAQRRHRREEPLYPHSLEMRALGQTGLVGAALLTAFFVAAFAAGRRLLRDPIRGPLVVATGASAGYWLTHASFEWLWELPAVTAPAMACLGLMVSLGAPGGPRGRRRSRAVTGLLTVAGLTAAVSYALPALAARDVERAARLWGDDRAAARTALDHARELNPLSDRPDVIAGALALEAGDENVARQAFARAVARDPHDWHSQAELAVLDLDAGRRTGAIARLRRAHALNPLEPAITLALASPGTPVPAAVRERLARLAVPGPLGRRPVACRPVLGLAERCTRQAGP